MGLGYKVVDARVHRDEAAVVLLVMRSEALIAEDFLKVANVVQPRLIQRIAT